MVKPESGGVTCSTLPRSVKHCTSDDLLLKTTKPMLLLPLRYSTQLILIRDYLLSALRCLVKTLNSRLVRVTGGLQASTVRLISTSLESLEIY